MMRRRLAAAGLQGVLSAVLLVGLLLPGTMAARAQDESLATAWRLAYAGRNVSAATMAVGAAAAAPAAERQQRLREGADLCVALDDIECAAELVRRTRAGLPAELEPATVATLVLLQSFLQVRSGDRSNAPSLGPAIADASVNPHRQPVLFADLHLLAAEQARRRGDRPAAAEHLDQSLAIALSLTTGRFTAARLIVRIAAELLAADESLRAVRLVTAATPLLDTIPPDSALLLELLEVQATLASQRRALDLVATLVDHGERLLTRLELRPATRRRRQVTLANDRLSIALMRGETARAAALIQAHPVTAQRADILARGRFAEPAELDLAVAAELAATLSAGATDPGWSPLLRQAAEDATGSAIARAYALGAFGLAQRRAGAVPQGRAALLEAGRRRLEARRDEDRDGRRGPFAVAVLAAPDRLLLEFAVVAAAETVPPDLDLIVRAQRALAQAVETMPDEALLWVSGQAAGAARQAARRLAGLHLEQHDRERAAAARLAARLTGPASSGARPARGLLESADRLVDAKKRLQESLEHRPAGDIGLAVLQRLLAPEEALVLHVAALGTLVKVCLRHDGGWLARAEVDGAALTDDVRMLRQALISTAPPSREADSQYPVAAARRLDDALFGGLQECLARSRRLYLVQGPGLLSEVPPAALLAAPPMPLGGGYDLRTAAWRGRSHAFVRTTSLAAFVAAKATRPARSAALDYLGLGDPRLSDEARQSGLPPLPETAEEIAGAAALFAAAGARVLTGAEASVGALDRQPLTEIDVLHFATHALSREEAPGLREPSLVLSPEPGGAAGGLLAASRIARLPLGARLVILSACGSARDAPSIVDDGVQGLVTGFALAGVPTALAALWPVDSVLARDLVVGTVRAARRDGLALADALAQAVRRHLDGPAARPFAHPRFWAALVVLGDGALVLDDAVAAGPRLLGPFAPPAADSGPIVAAAALAGDLATVEDPARGAERGGWFRRRAADGAIRWQVPGGAGSAGLLASAGDTFFVATGPVLQAFDAGGRLLWRQDVPGGFEIRALATAPDGVLVLTGPEPALVRFDREGRPAPPVRLAHGEAAAPTVSALLRMSGKTLLAGLNGTLRSSGIAEGFDWLGRPIDCLAGDDAELQLREPGSLAIRHRRRIERFEARDAVRVGDAWIVAGSERLACRTQRQAAAVRLGDDGTLVRLWRDHGPLDSVARGVRAIADGGLEIIGLSRPGPGEGGSGELFAVRLDATAAERGRDRVAAGVSLVPAGIVARESGLVVFGSAGARGLWLLR
ncbi:MAG: CHAT domain-containing protein [Reyranellaceae bacterium]